MASTWSGPTKYVNTVDLGEAVYPDLFERLGGGAHRSGGRPDAAAPTGSTGWPSGGCSTATSSATGCRGTIPSCGCSTSSTTTSIPSAGLYRRLVAGGGMRRLFTDDEVEEAVTRAPGGDQGILPGRVRRPGSGRALVAANWDSLVFDTGEEALRRVPMMEPLKGSKEMVGDLLDRCDTPAALIKALGGDRWLSRNASSRRHRAARRPRVDETAPAEQADELTEKIDDLLEEIDAVLEENAEEFVKNYVQKGGE